MKITLTTMCAVVDEINQKVLFINRKKNWLGYAFPGGHVEPGESITNCVLREVKEETGLTINHVKFKGIAHFYNSKKDEKYLIFNYYSNDFTGQLIKSTDEGEIMWVQQKDISGLNLAEGMDKRLSLFLDNSEQKEMFVEWGSDGFQKITSFIM